MKQGINLIPRSMLTARARRARLRTWVCVHAVLGSAAIAYLVAARPQSDGLLERLHGDNEHARTSLAQAQEQLAGTVAALRDARTRQAVARRLGARPDFSGLLRTMSQELDPRAALDHVLIAPLVLEEVAGAPAPTAQAAAREQYRVMISGVATNVAVASEYVLRLDRTGYFSHVSLTATTARDVGEIRGVEFHIAGTLGEGRLAGMGGEP